MAVDTSFTGRTYPAGEVYEVGREQIRQFAEAVAASDAGPLSAAGGDLAASATPADGDLTTSGDPAAAVVDPVHTHPAAARALGYDDVIAPPTFAVIVSQRNDARLVRDPEAGIDFDRVVHGEQAFVHHRPITAGMRLVASLHVDSVREIAGQAMVVTRSEITTQEGDPVCTATSMLVVRGDDG